MDFSDVLAQSRGLAARQQVEFQHQGPETASRAAGEYAALHGGRDAAAASGAAKSMRSMIPRLERDLDQINQASRRPFIADGSFERSDRDPFSGDDGAMQHVTYAGTPAGGGGGGGGSNAMRVLSEYGLEPNRLERSLQSIALLDTYEPLHPFADSDLDAFATQQNDVMILAAIDTVRSSVLTDSRKRRAQRLEYMWATQKADVVTRTAFVPGSSGAGASMASQDGTTHASAPGSGFAHVESQSRIRPQVEADYVDIVKRACVTSLRASDPQHQHASVSVAREFERAASRHHRGQRIEACFYSLRFICGEEEETDGVAKLPGRDIDSESRVAEGWRGARRGLELMFRNGKLRPTVESNPLLAKRGGEPGLLADVRGYINVLLQRGVPAYLRSDGSPLLRGLPLWPQIYFCFRCGDLDAVNEVVHDAAHQLEAIGSHFAVCWDSFYRSKAEHLLSEEHLDSLLYEYTSKAAFSPDPFRRACCMLLLRVQPQPIAGPALSGDDQAILFSDVEDYVWFQLSLVRVESGEPSAAQPLRMATTRALSLKEVQAEVQAFGPKYFDPKGSNPFLYASILLYCGCYNEAAHYLMENTSPSGHAGAVSGSPTSSSSFLDAFHIAFVLYFYRLLDSALYCNFLMRFVRPMLQENPVEAAVYAFSLHVEESHVIQDLLQRIILRTRKVTELLGSHRSGLQGSLRELVRLTGESGESILMRAIRQTARIAEEGGDRALAAKIYENMGSADDVLRILVLRLGAQMMDISSSARSEVLQEAKIFAVRLDSDASLRSVHSERLLHSFRMLLNLCEFIDLYNAGKLEAAWAFLRKLSLLPMSSDQVLAKASELRPGTSDYDDVVLERIPEILLIVMELLVALHTSARRAESLANVRGDRKMAAEMHTERLVYDQSAQYLINLSGMLQFPFAELSSKLIRLQVMMTW
ncbi:Nuclear pore complex protein Nup93 [Porphyridium purpureum]|uniref:Nuclear pore protein n=1 Tax=Porphyridium purpureum TaxID=35688 RepID=A0A5J4YRB0_PORPP|nr:Nuclear pore complex protein Nup93 [Porphyridium purpureum]|eukprot:POR2310..scf229_5